MKDNEIWESKKVYDYLMACARKKGIFTAKELADLAEVDPCTISRLKNDQLKSPSFFVVIRLFDTAGASLDYFLGINDPQKITEREIANKDNVISANDKVIANYLKLLRQRKNFIIALMIIILLLILGGAGLFIYGILNPYVGWFRDAAASFLTTLDIL